MSEKSWRKIAPGAYVDQEEGLHLVMDEMCEAAGVAPTDDNIARLALRAGEFFGRQMFGARGVSFEATPDTIAAIVAAAPAFAADLAARQASMERHPSRVPTSTCTSCGYAMDAATGFGPEPPAEGDFSVCFRCGEMLTYLADLTVRRVSNAEIMRLCRDEPDTATRLWEMSGAIIRRRAGR